MIAVKIITHLGHGYPIRAESRVSGLGFRYLKALWRQLGKIFNFLKMFHLSSKGILQFRLTGWEAQVFNLCGVVIKAIVTWFFSALGCCNDTCLTVT